MIARISMIAVTCLALPSLARAAEDGRGGEIVGAWKISADSLGAATYQVTFKRDGTLNLTMTDKSNNGDSHSSSSGPNWTQSANKLTFNGTAQVNQLKVSGAWTLTWDGPDTVNVKTNTGQTYTLTRLKEK